MENRRHFRLDSKQTRDDVSVGRLGESACCLYAKYSGQKTHIAPSLSISIQQWKAHRIVKRMTETIAVLMTKIRLSLTNATRLSR